MSQSPSLPHPLRQRTAMKRKATLRKRIHNAVDSHRRRAKVHGQALDYDVHQLADKVAEALQNPCLYCGMPLIDSTWSCDHDTPTSRGGSYALWNVLVCCKRCNELKGQLTGTEFHDLLGFLADLPAEARADVLRRLRAGGRMRR